MLAGDPYSPTKTPTTNRGQPVGSSFQSLDRAQRPPDRSTSEVHPHDSISMYSPFRRPGPSASVRSSRRGGTNVDPGEGEEVGYTPEERVEDDYASHAGVTLGSQKSGGENQEQMTLAPTTAWTTGTL